MLLAIAMFLKNIDAFGHQLNLTVKNVNGSQQTSKFGGTVIVIQYLFVCVYGVFKSIKMSDGNLDNFEFYNSEAILLPAPLVELVALTITQTT